MAQAAAKNRSARSGVTLSAPVKAESQIFMGALVVLLAGVGIAGRVATSRAELSTMKVAGVAKADVLGGASDGDETVELESGVFYFANSAGGDEITLADRNRPCFLVDDETVAKTVGVGLRPIAGTIIDVGSGGVWVRVGEAGDPRRVYVAIEVADLRGAQATVNRGIAPRAGAITRVWSKLRAALATGDATLTGKIGATAITTGVVTITQAGSAAGDTDNADPTALNVVAEGDEISFTVGGANTAQVAAGVLVEITY